MKFSASTRIPIASLSFLSRLKQRYDCGPLLELDAAQRALLAFFDAMYPREKYRALHAATEAGREYLSGADLAEATAK